MPEEHPLNELHLSHNFITREGAVDILKGVAARLENPRSFCQQKRRQQKSGVEVAKLVSPGPYQFSPSKRCPSYSPFQLHPLCSLRSCCGVPGDG